MYSASGHALHPQWPQALTKASIIACSNVFVSVLHLIDPILFKFGGDFLIEIWTSMLNVLSYMNLIKYQIINNTCLGK